MRNATDDTLAANGFKRKSEPLIVQQPTIDTQPTKHRRSKQAGQSKSKTSEHQEQVRLIDLCKDYPVLEQNLFAVPNGGFRTKATAGKLKAEGVKSGVPDLFLPVACRGYHGMFVELKITGNKPTDNQKEWLQRLANNGYYCIVAYGADAALERLLWYINGESHDGK